MRDLAIQRLIRGNKIMSKYSNIRKFCLKKLSFWAVGAVDIMRIFVTCFISGEEIPCEEIQSCRQS